ncbi:MAG: hypothetical protein U0670_20640 [Anaerolineae bacterium]
MTTLDRGVFNTNIYHSFHHARLEAMQILERCLADGDAHALEAYLETQLVLEPPPIDLLRHIADDLSARLSVLEQQSGDSPFVQRDRSIIKSSYEYLTDWLRGLSTRAAQRAAANRGAIIPIEEPNELLQ